MSQAAPTVFFPVLLCGEAQSVKGAKASLVTSPACFFVYWLSKTGFRRP